MDVFNQLSVKHKISESNRLPLIMSSFGIILCIFRCSRDKNVLMPFVNVLSSISVTEFVVLKQIVESKES